MARPKLRRLLKWTGITAGVLLVVLLVVAVGGGIWLRGRLRASLPRLDGAHDLAGLSRPVTVERDDLGVPTIRGANRLDVARATGFVHAQERFFQMDLLRRSAAGELSALAGAGALDEDLKTRMHRLRHIARRNVESADAPTRTLLHVYTDGVNAGLEALDAPPPEYIALRVTPEPWTPEDTYLVVFAMYLDLHDENGQRESDLGLVRDLFPAELADFLAPMGTEWDAPLVGDPLDTPDVPPAAVFDLRDNVVTTAIAVLEHEDPELVPGSNNWAVAGSHTEDGRALLANDMHLGLGMPNIWFRASFVWRGDDGDERRVTGVTLAGAPPIIVGSNGHVAWGFTNSQGDWSDLIVLETDPDDEDRYATPFGPKRIDSIEEIVAVAHGDDVTVDVPWTVWGPVIDRDHRGRRRVVRWVAHDPEAVNLGLIEMEQARDLDHALEIAARTAIPGQNCVVADHAGRIGWTLMGPIPRRHGRPGRFPTSWAGGENRWDGYLDPADYPRIEDPEDGRIWTANNRVVDGAMLAQLGNGGLATGARARQIRDGLRALGRADERDMLTIQLDDRALFLERWRELLLDTLTPEYVADGARRGELRDVVERTWTGHASIDSAAFRLVRAFRMYVSDAVFGAILASCTEADERFHYSRLGQIEGPMWRLIVERPGWLLDPRYASWDDLLLAAADRVIERFGGDGDATALSDATWGSLNTVELRHPLTLAVPQLGRWLNVPGQQLPGAGHMPRVQSARFGASERMVVSPGRETDGIFHMPGGQSGHFLSPYYAAGSAAWSAGEPTPFLPGETVHTLTLVPTGQSL